MHPKIYIGTLALLASLSICAQQDSSWVLPGEPKVFSYVEQNPEFPGGDKELMHFLQQNIIYPQMERDSDIQGKVLVRFVVLEDGSVNGVTVVKGVSPGIDSEAVRVVKLLPKFKPGIQQGRPVKVYFNLPIVFKLTDSDAAAKAAAAKALKEKAAKDADFRTGLLLINVGEWTEALKSLTNSVKEFPQDYLGYQYKGACEYVLKKLDEACQDYQMAKQWGSPDVDDILKKYCK